MSKSTQWKSTKVLLRTKLVVGSLWNQARSYQIFLALSNVLVCYECFNLILLWLSAWFGKLLPKYDVTTKRRRYFYLTDTDVASSRCSMESFGVCSVAITH